MTGRHPTSVVEITELEEAKQAGLSNKAVKEEDSRADKSMEPGGKHSQLYKILFQKILSRIILYNTCKRPTKAWTRHWHVTERCYQEGSNFLPVYKRAFYCSRPSIEQQWAMRHVHHVPNQAEEIPGAKGHFGTEHKQVSSSDLQHSILQQYHAPEADWRTSELWEHH